jgi:hypothetical protein
MKRVMDAVVGVGVGRIFLAAVFGPISWLEVIMLECIQVFVRSVVNERLDRLVVGNARFVPRIRVVVWNSVLVLTVGSGQPF